MANNDWARRICRHFQGWPSENEPPENSMVLPELSIPYPRNVQAVYRSAPINVLPACHQRAQLIIGLHGEGGVIVDKNLHRILPGTAILIFPFQCHHYTRFKGALSWLMVYFETDGKESALSTLRNRRLSLTATTWERLDKLTACVLDYRLGGAVKAGEAGAWLMLFLSALVNGAAAMKSGRMRGHLPAGHRLAERAVQYIMRQLAFPLKIEDIAREIGVSESRLRKICARILGMGLGEYIRALRINRACSLLATSGLSVKEIAHDCGFSSAVVFVRAFARAKGRSPTSWRTLNHMGQEQIKECADLPGRK